MVSECHSFFERVSTFPVVINLWGRCYLDGMMQGEAMDMGFEVRQVTRV